MKNQSVRQRTTIVIGGFCCVLIGAAIALGAMQLASNFGHGTTKTALAAISSTSTTGTIQPGHYTVTTNFTSGPKAGQSEQGAYDFTQDGSLTVYFPGVGTGYGTIALSGDNNHTYILTFREVIPQVGDIQVTQIVTDITDTGFTSQGFGMLYTNNQPQLSSKNMTTSVATLVHASS